MSGRMQELMKNYGIRHRVSSAYNPHSNCRAEVGVKTIKRMLRDNIDADGDISNSRFLAAILQYKNTPDRDTKLSPLDLVFGRKMNGFVPNT